jgi:phosphoglycolate phosphatase-like HAD superfamily hydrolase
MNQNFLPGTQIEIVNEIPRGQFKHVLFDFDGTISLLREGWQGIMVPVCIEMICGDSEPTDAIREAVSQMIDETTGIQTIFQMERLVEMIREYGLVPEAQMLDAAGYKAVYNERLLVPVRERLARLESGALSIEDATVPGALRFLKLLHGHGAAMYVFSGTDRDDVRHECAQVKANHFFQEIWGAIPSVEEYSKEKVIREIIAQHGLHGSEVLAVGDGPVELRNVKEHGGVALGIASDETNGGWDMHKRARLLKAGADILVPDFSEAEALYRYLMAVE